MAAALDARARQEAAVARSPSVAALRVARGAVAETGRIWTEILGEVPALIVADDNTFGAAGAGVEAALAAAGVPVRRHVLPGRPRLKPSRELGEEIAAQLGSGERFLALGAGVLNDLTKFAAFQRDTPYVCVATAASMDGYTSAGAPLSDRGFKKTIQCRPARAVVADLDVIGAAPSEMHGWGYGDMAGKVPAGADWLVADALGVEAVDPAVWDMVQGPLRDWLAAPESVARGEPAAVEGLFAGLAMVGFAMEAHGSSRPASGADHQIAHLWEMEDLHFAGERVSHGACVAVGCVAALQLYDWLLAQDLSHLDIDAVTAAAPSLAAKRAEITASFTDPGVAERAIEETTAKHLDPTALRRRLQHLRASWPDLAARLRTQLLEPAHMADLLGRAGAPRTAAAIGLDAPRVRATAAAARFLRSRYTVLDLLDETGLLEPALDACFGAPR